MKIVARADISENQTHNVDCPVVFGRLVGWCTGWYVLFNLKFFETDVDNYIHPITFEPTRARCYYSIRLSLYYTPSHRLKFNKSCWWNKVFKGEQ